MGQPKVELNDAVIASIITPALALAAARASFWAHAKGTAGNFPVVREVLRPGNVFGVKSGRIVADGLLGLKSAGYWGDNLASGAEPHQATILLVDPADGHLRACLAGNAITSWRTAAAAAVSIDLLARVDARTLCLVGAGAQAFAHLAMALEVRSFETIAVWSRTADRVRALIDRWGDRQPALTIFDTLDSALYGADCVITLTPATTPFVQRAAVTDGAHVAAMGSDTRGKAELDLELLLAARCFGDDRAQAFSIGEFQRLDDDAATALNYVGELGSALAGDISGRRSPDEITVFDGTGMAIQDLALAAAVLDHL